MGESDDRPGPGSEESVERGETYEHDEYGAVEVTGIWSGVEQVDAARNVDEKDVIIVRYSAEVDEQTVDELTDTLSEFLSAID